MKAQHKSPKTAYESAEADYLKRQKALQEMNDQKARLEKQKAATIRSGKEAGEAWRAQFKESYGQVSDAIKKLKAEEYGALEEAEQLEELIEQLTTHIDAEKRPTQQARERYEQLFYAEQASASRAHLEKAVKDVLSTEEGKELVEALAHKKRTENKAVLLDQAFMAGIGFDGHESSKRGFLATITREDRSTIEREAKKRVKEQVADLLTQAEPEKPTNAVIETLIPRLKYEV